MLEIGSGISDYTFGLFSYFKSGNAGIWRNGSDGPGDIGDALFFVAEKREPGRGVGESISLYLESDPGTGSPFAGENEDASYLADSDDSFFEWKVDI